MNAREYFKTKPCTNPMHAFTFGNIIGQWQIANDIWTSITDKGYEMTHWVRFGKLCDQEGGTVYELVIGKLMIAWGIRDSHA